MSNLVIAAIVVFVLALAAIPATLLAQNAGADNTADSVLISGRITFLAGGKALHDTGVLAKTPSPKDVKAVPGKAMPDDLLEQVALDCSELIVIATGEDKHKIQVAGKPGGADCAYELSRTGSRQRIQDFGRPGWLRERWPGHGESSDRHRKRSC